jgi:hypothetical protein
MSKLLSSRSDADASSSTLVASRSYRVRPYPTGRDAIEQHGDFDRALAMALVLLHELGHIRFGDRDSYTSNARLNLDELNKPSEMISNPEVRADAFASEVVEATWASAEMTRRCLHPLQGPPFPATYSA